MNITMIRKIKADGELCQRSAKVQALLNDLGLLNQVNDVVDADERLPESKGFVLAQTYQVSAAPFFIVTHNGSTQVYTSYSHFLKEIFNHKVSESDEISEMMAQNEWLDFL
jgi:protein-disulfide isomerase-like protein with CxxC motif